MRAFIFLTACCLWLPAQAGDIYKCSEGGRTVYREQPCNGAGAVLSMPPAPRPDPDFEARQARARNLVADIEARDAEQDALDERDARDAARRQQRQAEDRARHCLALRQRHQAESEREGRAIARNRGQARAWAEQDARSNERLRARALANECPG